MAQKAFLELEINWDLIGGAMKEALVLTKVSA